MSKKFGIFLLIVGLCMMLPGCILLCQTADLCQYVLPAGDLAETYPQAEKAAAELAELSESVTVSARRQSLTLSGKRDEIGVTLYAVDATYPEVCRETLKQGRYISPGDVEKQRRVLVIDEKTAYALFNGGDAIGQALHLAGMDWQIVGVVGSKARFGEADESVAYAPITAALALEMDTLELRVLGTKQAILAETTLRQWRTDGSFHDLAREKYAAAMPLRWCAIVTVLLLAVWLLCRTLSFGKETLTDTQARLKMRYLREMLPWLTGQAALLLLLGAVAAGVAVTAMKLLTAPALVFTDWIPENLVSIASYITRFWVIHRENAAAMQLLTREKSVVQLVAWLIRWGMLAVLGGAFLTKQNGRKST